MRMLPADPPALLLSLTVSADDKKGGKVGPAKLIGEWAKKDKKVGPGARIREGRKVGNRHRRRRRGRDAGACTLDDDKVVA